MKNLLNRLPSILLASAMIFSTPSSSLTHSAASDITGVWKFEVIFEDGRKGTPAFTFKQEGENLSGTYRGGLGEAPVTGTVKGDDVAFAFKVKVPDQEELTATFLGRVEAADLMKGTFKANALLPPGEWTAKKEK